jgi:PAS domain S-box-containing protein
VSREQPQSGSGRAADDDPAYVTDSSSDEDLLSAVVSSTSAGLLVVDSDTITFANEAIEKYVDYRPGNIVGTTVNRVFPKPFADRVTRIQSVDGGRQTFSGGDSILPDADQTDELLVTLETVSDSERVVVTFTDGGDRERGGTKQLTSDTRSQAVEHITDTGVIELDTDGTLVRWSTGTEHLTGWTAEDAVGAHVSILYPDNFDVDDVLGNALERARCDGKFEDEGWFTRSDGSEFWADTTITPVRGNNGEFGGFTMIVRDRTERKRLEDERELLAEVSRAVADPDTFKKGVQQALAAVCDRTQWDYGEA